MLPLERLLYASVYTVWVVSQRSRLWPSILLTRMLSVQSV